MKIKEVVKEGFWSTLLTPKSLKNIDDVPSRGTGMTDCQARAKARELYGAEIDPTYDDDCLGTSTAKGPKAPAPSPKPNIPPVVLHPDVRVISSYPLRLKYKNGDYVLDPNTDMWTTVTGKKIAPTLSSFLQHQADKL